MGKAETLIKNAAESVPTFAVEIGGVEFILRRFTTQVALQVMGSKLFGLLAAQQSKSKRVDLLNDEMAQGRVIKFYEKLCRVCMVSPSIGDETADDSITWDDFSATPFALEVINRLVEGVGESPFSEPSAASTEGESPDV